MTFELKYLAISSSDFAATFEFLKDALGATVGSIVQIPDYAQFTDEVGIALVADHDLPVPGTTKIMVKVPVVADAVEELVSAGADVLVNRHDGGHEVRAAVSIPGSSCGIVLYGPA